MLGGSVFLKYRTPDVPLLTPICSKRTNRNRANHPEAHLNKTFPPRTESVQMIRVGECRMRNLWRAIAQFFVEGLLDDADARRS
jgi:hypothetical protein